MVPPGAQTNWQSHKGVRLLKEADQGSNPRVGIALDSYGTSQAVHIPDWTLRMLWGRCAQAGVGDQKIRLLEYHKNSQKKKKQKRIPQNLCKDDPIFV